MKRQNGGYCETDIVLIPAYGKRKLLRTAESFRSLAGMFGSSQTITSEADFKQDRQSCLLQRQLYENREILADHLNEVAKIMTEVAEETYRIKNFREKEIKKIIHICEDHGILIKEIYQMESEQGRFLLGMNARVKEGKILTVDEVADFMSILFDKRLLAEKEGIYFLKEEYETIFLEEEAGFIVLTGAARATKENEAVSGDSYSFTEKGNGSILMALSDGMGSGEKAKKDSEAVIDLLEKFTETGFSKEMAVEMINGVLLARAEEGNMSTLDLCEIDLYTGICEIMKYGASCTFIKRDVLVEQIVSDSLPLGIFHQIQMEKRRCQLADGDYIIMVSDGILDSIGSEDIFKDMIGRITLQNPQEIANYILQLALHKNQGKVPDDMTVMILGIWQNNRNVDF